MLPESFRCFLVRKMGNGAIETSVEQRPLRELPPGDVLIRVACSSVNFKDALATQGNPGIVSQFPHVPGIDAAGTVEHSDSSKFRPGDKVICTGYELGAPRWGGWAEFIRVPAEWVVPLPKGLTLEESMFYGTAGFTAAQCVLSLQRHGVTPDNGTVLVTGATGGVGSIAVMLLAKLGYRLTAVSGKPAKHDWLRSLGVSEIISRQDAVDESSRPLLAARWAGAVDTVGGATLSTIVRSLGHRGCVAACGLVGGHELHLTVYPFLLRGVTLDGIDSAKCPYEERIQIWKKLSEDWKLDGVSREVTKVGLDDVGESAAKMLKGEISGRVLVHPG